MATTPTPPARSPESYKYSAVDKDVYRGMELIASARTHSMAKRIAWALNSYNYSQHRQLKKEQKKHGNHHS